MEVINERSPKDFTVTVLLCFFLGVFGIHRFYVGKIFTGILMLITGGGFGIWYLVDLVRMLMGRFTDDDDLLIKN